MWYRHAKELTQAELEREELEDLGGVKEKDGVDAWEPVAEAEESSPAPKPGGGGRFTIRKNPEESGTPQPDPLAAPLDEIGQDDVAVAEPPAAVEEPPSEPEPADDATSARVMEIPQVLAAAGVAWPAHDKCRCQVRVIPGSMTPIWESSPNACEICLDYERKFNQYVQASGVKVSA